MRQHRLRRLEQDIVLGVVRHLLRHIGIPYGGLCRLDVLAGGRQVGGGVLETCLDRADRGLLIECLLQCVVDCGDCGIGELLRCDAQLGAVGAFQAECLGAHVAQSYFDRLVGVGAGVEVERVINVVLVGSVNGLAPSIDRRVRCLLDVALRIGNADREAGNLTRFHVSGRSSACTRCGSMRTVADNTGTHRQAPSLIRRLNRIIRRIDADHDTGVDIHTISRPSSTQVSGILDIGTHCFLEVVNAAVKRNSVGSSGRRRECGSRREDVQARSIRNLTGISTRAVSGSIGLERILFDHIIEDSVDVIGADLEGGGIGSAVFDEGRGDAVG